MLRIYRAGIAAAIMLASCATAGRDFDITRVHELKSGVTNIADAERLFGKPRLDQLLHPVQYVTHHAPSWPVVAAWLAVQPVLAHALLEATRLLQVQPLVDEAHQLA